MDAQFVVKRNTILTTHLDQVTLDTKHTVRAIESVKVRVAPYRDAEWLEIRHLPDTDELAVLHHVDGREEPECVFSIIVPSTEVTGRESV